MNTPKDQANYIEARNQFDKSLVRIFPDRLPNNMVGFGFHAPYNSVPGQLQLTTKYLSEAEYHETKIRYLKQSKYQTTSIDKCLFIVDNYEEISQVKCKDFYPVSAEAIFENKFFAKTKMKTPDLEVFFLETVSGDFVKDEKTHTRAELPDNWLHGYSTGVTTNDKDRTIRYWLVVW